MKKILAARLVLMLIMPVFAQEQQPSSTIQGQTGDHREDAVATAPAPPRPALRSDQGAKPSDVITVPTGTKVLLVLNNSVSSRNGKVGDGVYMESRFPVTIDGRVVIPAGTYVYGEIARVQRSGRVKGRAEIQLRFNRLIYTNGYTVDLAGALDSADSSDRQKVKNDGEGTIQAEGTKSRDAETIARSTIAGGLIGGLPFGARGLGIGSGAGLAAGVLSVLLTRGDEVRLESGTSVEMILQRPLDLERDRIETAYNGNRPQTRQQWRSLPVDTRPRPATSWPLPGIPGIPH